MEITKDEFDAYNKVRDSGVTNMFDAKKVNELSGLSEAKIRYIMLAYKKLERQFNEPPATTT